MWYIHLMQLLFSKWFGTNYYEHMDQICIVVQFEQITFSCYSHLASIPLYKQLLNASKYANNDNNNNKIIIIVRVTEGNFEVSRPMNGYTLINVSTTLPLCSPKYFT